MTQADNNYTLQHNGFVIAAYLGAANPRGDYIRCVPPLRGQGFSSFTPRGRGVEDSRTSTSSFS